MVRRSRPQTDKVGSNGDEKVQVDDEGGNGGNSDIVSDLDANSDSSTGNATPRGRSKVPDAVASPARASQRCNRGMGRAPSDSASEPPTTSRKQPVTLNYFGILPTCGNNNVLPSQPTCGCVPRC
jgi:hypothetical protein